MDRLELLGEHLERASGEGWAWLCKRLSANDTGLTGSHQVGFYLPSDLARSVAPELDTRTPNPRRQYEFRLISHNRLARPSLIFYNNRFTVPGGTRDEYRMTGFSGCKDVLQDPAAVGSLLFLAFSPIDNTAIGWLARTPEEAELIQLVAGPVSANGKVARLLRPRSAST